MVVAVVVAVAVAVIGPVIVIVHVNGNATVCVIGPVDDDQGSIILVSMATTRSSSATPTP